MENIIKNIDKEIQNLDILDDIENKIKNLDNNEKMLVFLGSGIESFLLVCLLQKHFKKNLHCILLNTPLIEEKEFPNIISEYYKSNIKVLAINCREYFYKIYMDFENTDTKIIKGYNKIINHYKEYIKEDIKYFSFGFTKESSKLCDSMLIKNKIPFEPFLDLSKEEVKKISKYNIFFIEREDYWKEIC